MIKLIFLIFLILLQILDICTTVVGLRRGAEEANPFLRKLMEKIGVVPVLVGTKLLYILLLILLYDTLPAMFFVIFSVIYLLIVLWNVMVLKDAKKL